MLYAELNKILKYFKKTGYIFAHKDKNQEEH